MPYGTQNQYTEPPPAYAQVPHVGTSAAAREPLLDREVGDDDVPDDFKYGVSVSECDLSVRMAFVRKVYSILFVQILFTTIMAAFTMYNDNFKTWVQSNFSTILILFGLIWKRRSYPTNFILLSTFTLAEAYTVGTFVTFYETELVLQAFLITVGLFLGLTLFTFQSKYDFSGLLPFIVSLFFPFNGTFDLIIASATAIIFCGFIIYDTDQITKRLSPEEYIVASVDLYLDFINLFISILRILKDVNNN
ncbi:3404_t:CDS:2 [Entrophospora sp. SA101]|nr:15488_t:CDS:2 [Entrophospora sp. SA101]CAJ0639580.1 3404_t:CDS:2 [Entrophospora sp. SA101]